MCVLCSRKHTQRLFYDYLYRATPSSCTGVIQRSLEGKKSDWLENKKKKKKAEERQLRCEKVKFNQNILERSALFGNEFH